jgi:tetratricopeptide (TPR) repeat protein
LALPADRYYEILGLDRSALPEEIRQAYRDLVKVWHPDRFGHDPRLQRKAQEKTKELNEAYEALKAARAEPHSESSTYASRPAGQPESEFQSGSAPRAQGSETRTSGPGHSTHSGEGTRRGEGLGLALWAFAFIIVLLLINRQSAVKPGEDSRVATPQAASFDSQRTPHGQAAYSSSGSEVSSVDSTVPGVENPTQNLNPPASEAMVERRQLRGPEQSTIDSLGELPSGLGRSFIDAVPYGVRVVEQIVGSGLGGDGEANSATVTRLIGQLVALPRSPHRRSSRARKLNAEGIAALRQDAVNDALSSFKIAYESDPADVEVTENLGYTYLYSGRLAEAQHYIVLAVLMSPRRSTAWNNLGQIYALRDDEARAVSCFLTAVHISVSPEQAVRSLEILRTANPHQEVRSAASIALASERRRRNQN